MNEQTEKLLRELAEKLGTTTEHLWGVLVKQCMVEAVSTTVLFVFFVVVAIVLMRTAIVNTRQIPITDSEGKQVLNRWNEPQMASKWDKDDALPIACWIVSSVIALFSFGLMIDMSQCVIQAIWNPEYWALKQILGAMK